VVEGRFTTDHVTDQVRGDVEQLLESTGGRRDEDDSIIALRTVGSDGRSRAHLGGRSVPAGVLSEFTGSLLTVHGQNDQLRLQRSDQQLAALDRFAADAIGPLLETYRTRRSQWVAAVTELRERTEKARELAREADQLTFALNEIDAVAPAPHEDTDIAATVRRLSDLDSLRDAASAAHTALTGGDDPGDVSVMALLGEARDRLASTDDEILSAVGPRLAEAIAVVTDVGAELTSYLEDLPADPESLDTLLSRQAELKSLTRKYAADVDGVLAWAEDARTRLTGLDVSADAVAALTERVSTTGAVTAEVARKLSAARVKAAAKLSKAVSAELAGLAMGKAKLDVEVRPRAAGADDRSALSVDGTALHAGSTGTDEIEFRLSAHSGAQSLPLNKSASGGELSRVMLALEVVLARSDAGATMVFDEVDAGVGGRAAVEIGKRLARLARTHQVIVVTHLPQVAAFADTHLVVNKTDGKRGGPNSGVRTLTDSERVVELARMLAGLDDTETGRAHAEELLRTATAERESATA
jgi:DNA repair protein RecN (Recombination protein N)